MTKYIFLLAFSCCLVFQSQGQQLTPPQQKEVDNLFKKDKVVYFKFNVRSMQEIAQFAKIISVDKALGNQVYAHADKAQFSRFIKMNIRYTITAKFHTDKPKPKPTVKK